MISNQNGRHSRESGNPAELIILDACFRRHYSKKSSRKICAQRGGIAYNEENVRFYHASAHFIRPCWLLF
jgi:hypothetical protein